VPTCLVHNCEASQRLLYSYLLSLLSQDQIPFDPHQCSLPFNLPSLPSLSERSTHGVDGDGHLAMENDDLGGFREFRESAVCGGFVDD